MSQPIIIGLAAEGTTDKRFLEGIIWRTFEEVAFACRGEVEILTLQNLPKPKASTSFINEVTHYATQAYESGITVLCIHTDADDDKVDDVYQYKIMPAWRAVRDLPPTQICHNLIPIIPIQMTEAWLLADMNLLKAELGTTLSDSELGLSRQPEAYANPKEALEGAIRTVKQTLPRRRRQQMELADLYAPLGRKISLAKLEERASYRQFKDEVRGAFQRLNYL